LGAQITIAVDQEACTGCMLCAASCSAGAIEEERLDFRELLTNLNDLEQPVIGCKAGPEVRAHVRVECLGGLSEEHLIALEALVPRSVQLNATSCEDCRNGFVIDAVEKRLEKLRRLGIARDGEGVLLRKSEHALVFRERECNRRSFLFSMGRQTASTGANVILPREENQSVGRSKKHFPFRRKLLNAVLAQLSQEQYERLYAEYYYDIALSESCDSCCRCAAMCPTGALIRKRENGQKHIEFRSLLCSGCGLCAGFCPLDAIEVRKAGGKTATKCLTAKTQSTQSCSLYQSVPTSLPRRSA
jgi:ferredoxin